MTTDIHVFTAAFFISTLPWDSVPLRDDRLYSFAKEICRLIQGIVNLKLTLSLLSAWNKIALSLKTVTSLRI